MIFTQFLRIGLFLVCVNAILAHAQARLIVLNKQEHTAAIVDPISLKVISKVATGEGPHEAVVSADGKLAIVANYGAQTPGNSLSIIDIQSGKELRRHDLGALRRPHGMAIHGGKVYFTAELSRAVARYDVALDKVDWIMGVGAALAHMLVLSPDGKRLYTSNIGSHSVTVVRLDSPPNAPLVHISVGMQPEAIDIAPDGGELWAGHNADGGVSIIDTARNTVKETIAVGSMPIRLKFSPNGKWVVVSDPRGSEVIVIEAATRKIIKRIAVTGAPLGIQFTPDSKRVFVSRAQTKSVDVLDMEKLAITGSVETGDGPDGLAWRG